jgi:hypothetical protein
MSQHQNTSTTFLRLFRQNICVKHSCYAVVEAPWDFNKSYRIKAKVEKGGMCG